MNIQKNITKKSISNGEAVGELENRLLMTLKKMGILLFTTEVQILH